MGKQTSNEHTAVLKVPETLLHCVLMFMIPLNGIFILELHVLSVTVSPLVFVLQSKEIGLQMHEELQKVTNELYTVSRSCSHLQAAVGSTGTVRAGLRRLCCSLALPFPPSLGEPGATWGAGWQCWRMSLGW